MNKYQKINQFCSLFLKVNNIEDKVILYKFNKEKRKEISTYLNDKDLIKKYESYQREIDNINLSKNLNYEGIINKISNDLGLNPTKIVFMINDLEKELIKLKQPSQR